MKVTLKEFKGLIRNGARFTCVENTYRPELNGQERVIDKAQTNGWFWRIVGEPAKRYWTAMPKAAEIIRSGERYSNGEPVAISVTLQSPIGNPLPGAAGNRHTVTLEFAAEVPANA